MKISIPIYIVALLASFVYALVKYLVPTLPVTEEQVLFIIVAILTLAGIDVVQALKAQGLLPKK